MDTRHRTWCSPDCPRSLYPFKNQRTIVEWRRKNIGPRIHRQRYQSTLHQKVGQKGGIRACQGMVRGRCTKYPQHAKKEENGGWYVYPKTRARYISEEEEGDGDGPFEKRGELTHGPVSDICSKSQCMERLSERCNYWYIISGADSLSHVSQFLRFDHHRDRLTILSCCNRCSGPQINATLFLIWAIQWGGGSVSWKAVIALHFRK